MWRLASIFTKSASLLSDSSLLLEMGPFWAHRAMGRKIKDPNTEEPLGCDQ